MFALLCLLLLIDFLFDAVSVAKKWETAQTILRKIKRVLEYDETHRMSQHDKVCQGTVEKDDNTLG